MQCDYPEHVQFAAGGTVMKGGAVLEASGILEVARTEEGARQIGLEWARAWVDSHG